MSLVPKNWKTFQHYRDRKPVWIKLHRSLLDDYQFGCLPIASKALAPLLWLLASEYDDGEISASLEEIAFRLHMTPPDLKTALKPLLDHGFFIDASKLLARTEQVACLETETETERDSTRKSAREISWPSGFLEFYSSYPKKKSKKDAAKAYEAARREVTHEAIMAGLARVKPTWRDPQFIPYPASWLRAGGYDDDPNVVAFGKPTSIPGIL